MQTPWGILLCKFQDDTTTEPFERKRYEEIFTSSGNGKSNMVEFFRDVSHGNVDVSGSEVLGWLTIPKNRSAYEGSGLNPQGRLDLITWAKDAAVAAGHQLDKYFSVVVCMNVGTDLCGGPSGVICDGGSVSPHVLGQEMGHAYGLNHSRADGSTADYMDDWDIMSTAAARSANHPEYTELSPQGTPLVRIGPGLNAANMSMMSWLDTSRMWMAKQEHFGQIVELRPLHQRDLPGYLVAKIDDYLLELRVPTDWDAGIGPAVVLVHSASGGHSYIHRGVSGSFGLLPGDKFQIGDPQDALGALTEVVVESIDAQEQRATLRIGRRRDRHPSSGPSLILEGVSNDAGGLIVIFSNGKAKIKKVPPNTPSYRFIEALDLLDDGESAGVHEAGQAIRRHALQAIQSAASEQLQNMEAFREPALEEGSQGLMDRSDG